MRMRKYLLLPVALLAMLFGMASVSHAAEDVLITVTANPTELSEAGTVELNFSISNYTDYELHSVTISSNGGIFNLDQEELVIPANGSAYDIIIRIPVSDSQIGLPIDFDVSWTQGGEPMQKSVSVIINRAADPVISLTRSSNASMARKGDAVTVEYTLKNSTKFDMTEITLIDEELSDKPILSNHTLQAGNSITIQHNYSMGDDDVTSAPVITYSVLGRTKTFSAVEPLSIQVIHVKLNMAIEMGTPTPTGVAFSIEVKNTGNQDVNDITILDDKKNFVNQEPFSLSAGETEYITYRIVPSMDEPIRNVSFTLSGTDGLGNPYLTESSDNYEVYPYVDDAQIAVGIQAIITEPWSSSLGSLKVKLTIQNASTVSLSNVQISEQSLGIVKVIDALPQGETSFEQALTIGSPRNLTFSIKGIDPAGAMRELGSVNLQVAYTDAVPETMATPVPEAPGVSTFSALSGMLTKILIILGILMLIAFVTLVILSISERRYVNDLERRKSARNRSAHDRPYDDTGRKGPQKHGTALMDFHDHSTDWSTEAKGTKQFENGSNGSFHERSETVITGTEFMNEGISHPGYGPYAAERDLPPETIWSQQAIEAQPHGTRRCDEAEPSMIPEKHEYAATFMQSTDETAAPHRQEQLDAVYRPKVIGENKGQSSGIPQRNAVRRVTRKEQEHD